MSFFGILLFIIIVVVIDSLRRWKRKVNSRSDEIEYKVTKLEERVTKLEEIVVILVRALDSQSKINFSQGKSNTLSRTGLLKRLDDLEDKMGR